MISKVKTLVERKDGAGLDRLLSQKPDLANKGITIPYDFWCNTKAHPLHRLCDAVFAGKMTDEEAIALARIFLGNGARIDGDKSKDKGTPLLAAASLHAEQLGIFYINNGADIHYTYKKDGASALHWAAFCGRDKLAEKLIHTHAEIDEPDNTYNSTPLGWAIHSLQSNDKGNKHRQVNCIILLLMAGADTQKLDEEKRHFLIRLAEEDPQIQKLLN